MNFKILRKAFIFPLSLRINWVQGQTYTQVYEIPNIKSFYILILLSLTSLKITTLVKESLGNRWQYKSPSLQVPKSNKLFKFKGTQE
jgi:hypothetical protein